MLSPHESGNPTGFTHVVPPAESATAAARAPTGIAFHPNTRANQVGTAARRTRVRTFWLSVITHTSSSAIESILTPAM